ncbi:ABC transporter permease [Gorillibacterium timonense]|uniref:ABC transporter permease n=1 Tax=Gorillibacterium timonense TaxID=1689269 RepID=UPI00071D1C11|nr:ABC transporter permease [Gorillibacterium timonense]
MLNLIRNENMKIYNRVRTWILIGLLVIAAVLTAILSYSITDHSNRDWQSEARSQIESFQSGLNSENQMVKKSSERIVKVAEYRLEHNIPPADDQIWGGVLNAASLIILVSIFTVIIAADIVAGEFSTGTIKLLLIRPAVRAKVLLSKYLATLLFSLLLLALLFGSAFLTNGFLLGFGAVDTPYLYLGGDGLVHERSMILHVFSAYGLECVSLLMIVTMAFMISTVFRSSSLAIALSLLVLLLSSVLVLALNKYDWMRYYLFANTDLTQYLNGTPPFEGMTLGFSIAVLSVYFVLFNALSWLLFTKRDVRS